MLDEKLVRDNQIVHSKMITHDGTKVMTNLVGDDLPLDSSRSRHSGARDDVGR